MKFNDFSTGAMLALLTGGCANLPSVGPDYHKPTTKAPAQWTEPLAGGETWRLRTIRNRTGCEELTPRNRKPNSAWMPLDINPIPPSTT